MNFLDAALNVLAATSWRIGLLIALCLGLRRVLRGRLPAAAGFAVWLVLAGALLVPVGLPTSWSPFGLIPLPKVAESGAAAVPAAGGVAEAAAPASVMVDLSQLPNDLALSEMASPALTQSLPSGIMAGIRRIPALRWATLFWLAGVAVLVGRRATALMNFSRRLRRSLAPADGRTVSAVERCRVLLGIKGEVKSGETSLVETPALHGIRRPRLLMPLGMAEKLNDAELELVVLHELGHVRRRDLLAQTLIHAAAVLHWFNPLAWLAAQAARADCEHACDEFVLGHVDEGRREDYGAVLLKSVGLGAGPGRLPAVLGIFESKKQLQRRIEMIAGYSGRGWTGFLVGGLFVGVVAAVALTREAVAQNQPSNKRRVILQLGPSADSREAQLTKATEILGVRLNGSVVANAVIRPLGANRIEVVLPGDFPGGSKLIDDIIAPAQLEFRQVHPTLSPRTNVGGAVPAGSEVLELAIANRDGGGGNESLYVKRIPEMSGDMIAGAGVQTDAMGKPEIQLVFSDAGRKRFAEITRAIAEEGKQAGSMGRLAIVIDGKLHSAPTVRQEIDSASAMITGNFTEQEARDLAERLSRPLNSQLIRVAPVTQTTTPADAIEQARQTIIQEFAAQRANGLQDPALNLSARAYSEANTRAASLRRALELGMVSQEEYQRAQQEEERLLRELKAALKAARPQVAPASLSQGQPLDNPQGSVPAPGWNGATVYRGPITDSMANNVGGVAAQIATPTSGSFPVVAQPTATTVAAAEPDRPVVRVLSEIGPNGATFRRPNPDGTVTVPAAGNSVRLIALNTVHVQVNLRNADGSNGAVVLANTELPAGDSRVVPWATALNITASVGQNLQVEANGARMGVGFTGYGQGYMPAPGSVTERAGGVTATPASSLSSIVSAALQAEPDTLQKAEKMERLLSEDPTAPENVRYWQLLPRLYLTLATEMAEQKDDARANEYRTRAISAFERGNTYAGLLKGENGTDPTMDILNLAKTYLDVGQIEKGADILLEALRAKRISASMTPRIWLFASTYYTQAGKLDRAIAVLKEAAASFPQDGQFDLQLSQAYYSSEQLDQAIDSVREAIRKGVPGKEASMRLSEAYYLYSAKRFKEASEAAAKGLALPGVSPADASKLKQIKDASDSAAKGESPVQVKTLMSQPLKPASVETVVAQASGSSQSALASRISADLSSIGNALRAPAFQMKVIAYGARPDQLDATREMTAEAAQRQLSMLWTASAGLNSDFPQTGTHSFPGGMMMDWKINAIPASEALQVQLNLRWTEPAKAAGPAAQHALNTTARLVPGTATVIAGDLQKQSTIASSGDKTTTGGGVIYVLSIDAGNLTLPAKGAVAAVPTVTPAPSTVDATVQNLIDREKVIAEFRKIKPGQKEVRKIPDNFIDQEIAAVEKEQFGGDRPKYLAYVQSLGLTREEYRRKIEDDIIFRFMLAQLQVGNTAPTAGNAPAQAFAAVAAGQAGGSILPAAVSLLSIVTIIVNADGSILFQGEKVGIDELLVRLKKVAAEAAPAQPTVLVRADPTASAASVIRVIDALNQSGLTSMKLTTTAPQSAPAAGPQTNADPATAPAVGPADNGGRLVLNVKDVPAQYTVINRQFIDALGITDINEAASWAPGQTFLQVARPLTGAAVQTVTVLGQVMKPGKIELPAGVERQPGRREVLLMQVIPLAGGFTDTADLSKVKLSRILPDGTTKTWDLDVDAVNQGLVNPMSLPAILPGDIVDVPARVF